MVKIIGVRFKSGGKQYYFDPAGLEVQPGQGVIVETSRGLEYGECAQGNTQVEEETVVQPLRPLVRIATEEDEKTVEKNQEKEAKAFQICQEKIAAHGLEMKLVEAEYSFEGNKVLFFFTAEGRVDFRALVKDLASTIHARIELRQIGVRDEAKMLGGLGICGRPFCCAQFLDEFQPVSIKMAKTQNLSLNPTKISGTCGRLMCCLKYEQNAYEDAAKRMPKVESFVQTPDGPGNVKSVELLRETRKVSLDSAPEAPKCYHNCEVCVLRNGKGSRDGIAVPAERPSRYVEEQEEEFLEDQRLTMPFYMTSALEEAPMREKIGGPESGEGGKPRRRHRGGRHRGKSGAPKTEQPKEKTPPKQPKAEQQAEAKTSDEGAKRRRPRHRGGRRRKSGEPPKGE